MATVTPLYGWTDDKARLYLDSYWSGAPGRILEGLRHLRYHAFVDSLPGPGRGYVHLLCDKSQQSVALLSLGGLADNVFEFEEVSLKEIKKNIDSEYGSCDSKIWSRKLYVP